MRHSYDHTTGIGNDLYVKYIKNIKKTAAYLNKIDPVNSSAFLFPNKKETFQQNDVSLKDNTPSDSGLRNRVRDPLAVLFS